MFDPLRAKTYNAVVGDEEALRTPLLYVPPEAVAVTSVIVGDEK